MCWNCDLEINNTTLTNGFIGSRNKVATTHFGALTAGDVVTAPTALLLIDDAVPDDTSTTATLTVGADPIVGTLETIGDQDYYKVELVAGETYEIGMYAKYGGPNGVPLLDALFEIRDAAGTLLTSADGGGATTHNAFFTGFDALISFTAPASGVYYINARAYDDGVTGEDTGNYVGDYELFVNASSEGSPPPSEPPSDSLFLTTTDTAGNDLTTTATIEANAPSIVSTIDAPRDQDFYKIEMEAGKVYRITQSTVVGGPSGVPLADAYFEIYDPQGRLVGTATAGGPMPTGLVTTTVNAQMDFAPETSGTYYINARYANLTTADGNTAGEGVGDYELGVEAWTPYYSPDSPLYAIDWGTQIDGSSRNPDGEEGPRPTGNAHTGHGWNPEGIEGKNVVYYYFAKQGEVFVDEDPTNPGLATMVAAGFSDWEINAYEMALDEFEKVADVVYIEVQKREEADFVFITYDGTPDVGILGRMSPPDTANEGQTEFNRNGPGWNAESLKPGGFSFQTLMHELGHGHGLAHPHDNGGRSGELRGVEAEGTAFDYTTGAYDLNQGIHTIMSYEDGWQTRPEGHGAPPTDSSYGWVGSLSPFDIAVLQDKYGVNEDTATGNNTYRLKDVNTDGTFYSAIWDAAGIDQIVYSGARDATINLQAASLEYEYGGGGWMSYALGIHGGFTIANGVTIENASAGSGDDKLVGNDVRNILRGNDGDDELLGHDGNDTLFGGAGNDELTGHSGNDFIYGGTGDDVIQGGRWADTINGGEGADDLAGNKGRDVINGGDGNDRISGGSHADLLNGGAGADLFVFDGESADGSRDTIELFSRAEGDKIDLSAIDADRNAAGDQAFTFVGSNAFSGTAGELRVFVDGKGNQVASADIDGDKVADLEIAFVSPAAPIGAADFVF